MSTGKSIVKCKAYLDSIFGSGTPSSIYVGLFTTCPTLSSDTYVEVSGGAYARATLANNTTNFPAATQTGTNPPQKSNAVQMSYPTSTASWGTVVGAGLFDASSGGNLLYWTSLSSFSVGSGKVLVIPIGKLIITER